MATPKPPRKGKTNKAFIPPKGEPPSGTLAFTIGGSCPLVDLRTVAYEFRVGTSFVRNMLATLGVPVLVVPTGGPVPLELINLVALEMAIFQATFPLAPEQDIVPVMEWVNRHYGLGRRKAILELLRSTAPAARHMRYRVSRGGWTDGRRKQRRGTAAARVATGAAKSYCDSRASLPTLGLYERFPDQQQQPAGGVAATAADPIPPVGTASVSPAGEH